MKDWQLNTHLFPKLSMDEARETLLYLTELDAELQGAIRICRNRISTLKDMENAELRSKIDQLQKQLQ